MRVRSWLVVAAVSALAIASCTYDYDAPFSVPDAGTSGSSGEGGPSNEGGSSGDGGDGATGDDGGCGFGDDWERAVGNTFPVSWFRLDEAEPASFMGTGVRSAMRGAGTTRIPYGAVRSANGAQHLGSIDFGDVWPVLNGTGGRFAIAFWFRAAPPPSDTVVLFSKKETTPQTRGITFDVSSIGTFSLYREGGDGGLPLGFEAGRMASNDGWNRWHHVVVQRNQEATKPLLQFYIDGVKRDWEDVSATYAAVNAPFRFGPFEGDLDEVLAYDRLLTQSEVYALIDAATAGACGAGLKSVCYGATAKGTCEGALAKWVENCPDSQVCVMDKGTPRCVVDPCPK